MGEDKKKRRKEDKKTTDKIPHRRGLVSKDSFKQDSSRGSFGDAELKIRVLMKHKTQEASRLGKGSPGRFDQKEEPKGRRGR